MPGLHQTVMRRQMWRERSIHFLKLTGPRPFSAVLMMKCLPPVRREISSPCWMFAPVQS